MAGWPDYLNSLPPMSSGGAAAGELLRPFGRELDFTVREFASMYFMTGINN